MRTTKLGCFTGAGVVAILVTFFSLGGVALASGLQMFAAGDLNAQPGQVYGGVNSHAQIKECSACHTAPWSADSMADRCANCHTDVAAQMFNVAQLHGVIMEKSGSLVCRDCHPDHRGSTAPLTFLSGNVFPHETLGFSLKNHRLKDGNVPFTCDDCHGEIVTLFSPDSCQTCHGEMDVVFTKKHILIFGTDCLACHNGLDKFDHKVSTFKLEGEHQEAACEDCHQNNFYKGTPSDCYSCHKQDDEHGGEFGADCSACHSPNDWEDANFDHDSSNFPLTGAHGSLGCESCHKNGLFGGMLSTCVSCHTEPVSHAGQFGTECGVCHTTHAWTPAEFSGEHTFPIDHGESGNTSCITCHPAGFKSYTCYGCHEHTEVNIRSEHLEEGISNFENCMECHADGREHD